MHGTITKLENKRKDRCNHWRLRVSTKDEAGRHVQRSRNVWCSYREAKELLHEFYLEVKRAPLSSSLRCGEWFSLWLSRQSSQLASGSIEKNKRLIACANEFLSDVALRNVKPSMLEEIYEKLMRGERANKRAVSGTYAAMVHTCLHTCFKDAQKDGLIASNPCELARRPKTTTKEKQAVSITQLERLEAVLDPVCAVEFACLLAFKTGLRRGEIYGLEVRDWNKENHVLRVERAYTTRGELKKPKTKKSIRTIPLTRGVESLLEKRVRAIESDFKAIRDDTGLRYPRLDASTPLICNEVGERQNPSNLSLWWRRNREGFGLGGICAHELRHSYISAMVNRGADLKTVSELAGHSSIRVTADIYTHSEFEHKREAVEKFGI